MAERNVSYGCMECGAVERDGWPDCGCRAPQAESLLDSACGANAKGIDCYTERAYLLAMLTHYPALPASGGRVMSDQEPVQITLSDEQDDGVWRQCSVCGGVGEVQRHKDDGHGGYYYWVPCAVCDGEGAIPEEQTNGQ